MSDTNDFNASIIAEFRENGGVVGGPFEGMPLLLLHTTGAKSGADRVNPVVPLLEGDEIYVFASKAGAPSDPDWYRNLVADPAVTVELGTETFAAKAEVLAKVDRDRVYASQAAIHPNFAEYETLTDRVIPVVRLTKT